MKKVTAILLTVTMLVSLTAAAYAAAFSDVGEEYGWARDAIEAFSEEGIIEGKGDGIFAPDEAVTRAEFAKMFALTFELPLDEEASPYQDVADDYWAAPYILAADEYTVAMNVLDEAMDESSYAPERDATREEIAAALVNILPASDEAQDTGALDGAFSDSADINQELAGQLARAYELGLIQGYDDGTLRPRDSVTRAETVVLLDRALEIKRQMEAETSPTPTASTTPTATPSTTPTATPSATPTVTPTATPAATPKTAEDLVSVVSISQTSMDGERGYALYYTFGSVVAEEPLFLLEDVEVGGVKTALNQITCGDLLLFDTRANGQVRILFVIYSPGTEAPSNTATLGDLIKFPASQNWKFSSSDSRAADTVYFGRISKTRESDEGVIVNMELGDYSDAALVTSDTARLSVYEPYQNNAANRFQPLDIRDLQGTYEFHHDYIFIRAKNDVITDVIVIDYSR